MGCTVSLSRQTAKVSLSGKESSWRKPTTATNTAPRCSTARCLFSKYTTPNKPVRACDTTRSNVDIVGAEAIGAADEESRTLSEGSGCDGRKEKGQGRARRG